MKPLREGNRTQLFHRKMEERKISGGPAGKKAKKLVGKPGKRKSLGGRSLANDTVHFVKGL